MNLKTVLLYMLIITIAFTMCVEGRKRSNGRKRHRTTTVWKKNKSTTHLNEIRNHSGGSSKRLTSRGGQHNEHLNSLNTGYGGNTRKHYLHNGHKPQPVDLVNSQQQGSQFRKSGFAAGSAAARRRNRTKRTTTTTTDAPTITKNSCMEKVSPTKNNQPQKHNSTINCEVVIPSTDLPEI